MVMIPMMMIPGMYVPPRPVGQGKGLPHPALPRKKEALPRPALPCKKEALPRPVKITRTYGTQQGKVDFNPLKFGRQLQGRQIS